MACAAEARNLKSLMDGILECQDDEESGECDRKLAALHGKIDEGDFELDGEDSEDDDSDDDDYDGEGDEYWDLNALGGGRRLMGKRPLDADIWRNPFGIGAHYYQASCKLHSAGKWEGNVSLFQNLAPANHHDSVAPISMSASIKELRNDNYMLAVYDSDPMISATAPNKKLCFGRFMPN